MTSRRVPVPNPKFARSSSDDDDDEKTKSNGEWATRAQRTQVHNVPSMGLKQQGKIKSAQARAKKTVEALVVATNKSGNPSGKKAEKDADPLVQPSKILIPQNGDDGPKKWRLADQRRCALNVITRLNHRRRILARVEDVSIDGVCPFGRFWSSTER